LGLIKKKRRKTTYTGIDADVDAGTCRAFPSRIRAELPTDNAAIEAKTGSGAEISLCDISVQ
jgi:hypothetical protein